MFALLVTGLTLGFSSGVAPGPFQAYLLSQALKNGWRRTLPASLAPLFSDGIIITAVLLVLTQTPVWFLRTLKIAGGAFIVFLAWRAFQSFRTPPQEWHVTSGGNQSLFEAVTMNFLNPNPWIFWSAISGPILIEAWRTSHLHAVAFLAAFYCTLIGVFALLVLLFASARKLGPRVARAFTGVSALALLLFGVFQIWRGVTA